MNSLYQVSGHLFAFGDCPNFNAKADFDLEKFEGPWYVIEKFAAVSKCIRENVTRSGSEYTIRAQMDSLGVPLFQDANVQFFNGLPKSIMRINFPDKYELEPTNYWILDTDYTGWAVVWSCEEATLVGHQESAQIMSRLPILDTETKKRIKTGLRSLGVTVDNFVPVNQFDCTWDLKGQLKKS